MELQHLAERRPEFLPHLGLTPDWRFVVARDMERVWFDTPLFSHGARR